MEDPFSYPFVKRINIKRQADQPFSDYKAFYLITEDFEPALESVSDYQQIKEVLTYASGLSDRYGIPWTHFVDANVLAPAYIGDSPEIKKEAAELVSTFSSLVRKGDDCELHIHGKLNENLIENLRTQEKLHIRMRGLDSIQNYRQRKSFFYNTFDREGYRQLVVSLSYGKRFLEKSIYDAKTDVIAFRPGGWDHGASSAETLIYFNALADAGISVNSGLSRGIFGSVEWQIGNSPNNNLALINLGEVSVFEISPVSGAGGYINPVIPVDLTKLAGDVKDEIPVILSVYHLGALMPGASADNGEEASKQAGADQSSIDRRALEKHFQMVDDLHSQKVLYPITIRELYSIITKQSRN